MYCTSFEFTNVRFDGGFCLAERLLVKAGVYFKRLQVHWGGRRPQVPPFLCRVLPSTVAFLGVGPGHGSFVNPGEALEFAKQLSIL